MPTTAEFRAEIEAQIERAAKQGRPHVEINAGELHRTLGGYLASGAHQMPACCEAMRQEMARTEEKSCIKPTAETALL